MRLAISLASLVTAAATAHAGAALDASTPARTTDTTVAPDSLTTIDDKVEYGIDLRLRSVYVPHGLLGLFVERAPDGSQNYGWGIDFVRRRGNLELQLGFEHESITPAQGVWIDKGKSVPGDAADYILSPENAPGGESLGWYTFEFTFLNNVPINKYVAVRYGGGAGLGIITGGLYRWDVQCAPGATNDSPEPGCKPIQLGGQAATILDSGGVETSSQKYNLPPVFPVVNAILGLQLKPIDHMVINVELGIRTLPFIGTSIGYFF